MSRGDTSPLNNETQNSIPLLVAEYGQNSLKPIHRQKPPCSTSMAENGRVERSHRSKSRQTIDEPSNSVKLAVIRWSAWAPGLSDASAWKSWAAGTHDPTPHPDEPDVSFVPAMVRRRLSPLTRMVFCVEAACHDDETPPDAYVYCSRYGEYERTFDILSGLARREEVSPTAFSHSVHNTSASLFSVGQKDSTPYTAIAAGAATLETAFVESWSLLKSREASRVLLIYHDEPLPPLYEEQPTNVTQRCALALVLEPENGNRIADRLDLSWHKSPTDPEPRSADGDDPAFQVLRLLINGGEPISNDTGRLVWRWARHAGAN